MSALFSRLFCLLFAASIPLAASINTAAAANNLRLPELGRAGGEAISPSEEFEIGQDVARQLQRMGALIEDPLLDEYINSLGYRLVAASGETGQPFEFFIVKDRTLNAFALPGGFIGVNAGLILTTKTESELAGVMAHEVAHVTQEHIARRLAASDEMALKSIAALLGAILIGMKSNNPDATQAAILAASASSIQQQINFTRENEYEADRVGIGILANAGFDTLGMVNFFVTLHDRYGSSLQFMPEYLSTHPLTMARITEARQRARDYANAPVHETRLYALMRARLRVLTADSIPKALDYLQRTPTQSADEQLAARYGQAVALQRLGNYAQALALYEQLNDDHESIIAFHIGLAETQAGLGNSQQARETYQQAMALFPTSMPLQRSYVEFLLANGEAGTASRLVAQMLMQHPQQPALHHLLANALQMQGRNADSHYQMAEYYELRGNLEEAVMQIRIASNLTKDDSLQAARIEARLKVLDEKLEQQKRKRNRR